MSRSRLFTLHARCASVRLAQIAMELRNTRAELRQSQDTQERLGCLMNTLVPDRGVINMAQLRDLARLSERLVTEQARLNDQQHSAEEKAEHLQATLRAQILHQSNARTLAAVARQKEDEDRLRRQDATRADKRVAR